VKEEKERKKEDEKGEKKGEKGEACPQSFLSQADCT
jgi:hypothetical protein